MTDFSPDQPRKSNSDDKNGAHRRASERPSPSKYWGDRFRFPGQDQGSDDPGSAVEDESLEELPKAVGAEHYHEQPNGHDLVEPQSARQYLRMVPAREPVRTPQPLDDILLQQVQAATAATLQAELEAIRLGDVDLERVIELYDALYAVGLVEEADELREEVISTPPQFPKREHTEILHGDVRVDHYRYLHDVESVEVQRLIARENQFTELFMRQDEDRQEELLRDCKMNLAPVDYCYPERIGKWEYSEKWFDDKSYPVQIRFPAGAEDDEQTEVLFDINEMADGHENFYFGGFELSDDQRFAVYSYHTDGSEMYTLRIRDFETGKDLDDVLKNCSGAVCFHPNGKELFYATLDRPHRGHKVWRHIIGESQEDDELVSFEDDKAYEVGVWRSLSDRFAVIATTGWGDMDIRLIDLEHPEEGAKLVTKREPGLVYDVCDREDKLYIRTNADGAKNYKIMVAPIDNPNRENWVEFEPYDPDVYTRSLTVTKDYLIVDELVNETERVRFVNLNDGSEHIVIDPTLKDEEAPKPLRDGQLEAREHAHEHTEEHYEDDEGGAEPFHVVFQGVAEYEPHEYLVEASSLTRPERCYAIDPITGTSTLRSHDDVMRYQPTQYVEELIYAESEDGVEVPISIVRPNQVVEDDKAVPTLLLAYGSYGDAFHPNFNNYSEETSVNDIAYLRLRLLEMGYAVAIAHVRGGDDLGADWYHQARREKKMNSVKDLSAGVEHLWEEGYSDHFVGYGRSAGGGLMGKALTERPDLFTGMIIGVGALDTVNSLLDNNLPLSHGERIEYGDPTIEAEYRWLKEWSPHESIKPADYPTTLITAGLQDKRVHYREPLRFAAKLRENQEGDGQILFTTDHGGPGHFGRSGRLEKFEQETSFFAAFFERVVKDALEAEVDEEGGETE